MNTPTLRFKEFSGAWEVKTIEKIADVKGGKRLAKGYSLQNENNGIPYITVSDMYQGGVDIENIRYVPFEIAESIKNYKISVNDIFISVAGTLGVVGIVPLELDNANLTENANKLTNLKCNQQYLLQYLMSNRLEKLIDSVKTNSAQPKLAIYALNSFEISLPTTLPEQTKIANFLTAIDEKIAQLSQTAQLLTDYKKGVMQQIFSQQLRFKDDDGREFDEWKKTTFSNFVTERSEISNDDSLPTYSLTIENGVTPKTERYEREHLVGDTDNAYKLVKQYDFAYNPMNLRFGAIAKYTGEGSVKVSKYYNIFYVRNTDNATFFEAFIKSPDMLKFYDKMSTGSLIEKKRVHFTDFLKFKFNLPSLPEQTKIANFLTAIDDKINHNQTQLDAMKHYKAGLLQQMFV